jgi:hypothetical protein
MRRRDLLPPALLLAFYATEALGAFALAAFQAGKGNIWLTLFSVLAALQASMAAENVMHRDDPLRGYKQVPPPDDPEG